MSLHSHDNDQQVAYSLEEARRHLARGDRRRAADELQFAAERAVDPRHLSVIRQLASSSRDSSRRFGRGRWQRVLETLEQRPLLKRFQHPLPAAAAETAAAVT